MSGIDYEKLRKSFVIGSLRKASYRWPAITEAMSHARVERGVYACAKCGTHNGRKEIERDHIIPIVPVTGFDGFEGYIQRLFCDASGIQILCVPCHDVKTKKENEARKLYRKILKEKANEQQHNKAETKRINKQPKAKRRHKGNKKTKQRNAKTRRVVA